LGWSSTLPPAASARLRQPPVPRGGGVIPREAWKIWPEVTPQPQDIRRTKTGEFIVELPLVSYVLVAVDTAFSERETADFSACVVLGVWERRREEVSRATPWMAERWGSPDPHEALARSEEGSDQPRVCLMEGWVTRAGLNDMTLSPVTQKPVGLVPRLLDTCRRRQAHRIILENANRGKDTADELRRQMYSHEFDVELVDPTGSKLARMHSVSPLFSAGLVYSPANLIRVLDKDGRETVDVREFAWVAEIASQCLRTPRGKQDLADCVSMGLQWLRNAGMLELQHEFIKSELERRAWKPKPLNVGQLYGVA
jgi:phage terminase large subunit-like protein